MTNNQVISKHPKALSLLAKIQRHMYNDTISNEVRNIIKSTRDEFILEICSRIIDNLGLEIDTSFEKIDTKKLPNHIKKLVQHLEWANKEFQEVEKLKPECDFRWIESPFKFTQLQLLELSNYYTLLDKIPDITDIYGQVIQAGDLVYVACQDDKGNDYKHYGIVVATPEGFYVAHFFTGKTVKSENTIVEKGFGYIHEVEYEPHWILEEHLTSSLKEVIERIQQSKLRKKSIWNKLTYNCEHWAREMFTGNAQCDQLNNWKEEIKKNKELKNNSVTV